MEIPDQVKYRFTTALDGMARRLKSYAAKPTADPSYIERIQAELNAIVDYYNQAELVIQNLSSSGGVVTFNAPRLVDPDHGTTAELKQLRTMAAYYGWMPTHLNQLCAADFKDMRRELSKRQAQQNNPELY